MQWMDRGEMGAEGRGGGEEEEEKEEEEMEEEEERPGQRGRRERGGDRAETGRGGRETENMLDRGGGGSCNTDRHGEMGLC